MGFSFRKKISLGKGLNFNLSKSGISMSGGIKGARLTHHVLGKHKGRTTFYGQKRIAGMDVRYIKSSKGQLFRDINNYDYKSNEESINDEDLDEKPEVDILTFIPEKLPLKPGKIQLGWFILLFFLTIPFLCVGAWIYLLIKFIQRSNKKKIKEWEEKIKVINRKNKEKKEGIEKNKKELQDNINESIENLKRNNEGIKKALVDWDKFELDIKKEKVAYENKYIPKSYKTNFEEFNKFLKEVELSSNYKGCVVSCNDCNNFWSIRKEYGFPVNCPKCRCTNLCFEKIKSFKKKRKIDLSKVNKKELDNLNEEYNKIIALEGTIQEMKDYLLVVKGLKKKEELKSEISNLCPLLDKLKEKFMDTGFKLDIEA
ncbi:MAG: DUF4236 domain-containing protein [archaeon]